MTGPGLGGWSSQLDAVAAVAPDDVWALGSRRDTTPPIPWGGDFKLIFSLRPEEAYSAHWDRKRWSIEAIPGVAGTRGLSFGAMTALAKDDIWAVGTSHADLDRTLVVRWNGAGWSTVPSPNLTARNHLLGIAAISSTDIWSVGYYEDANRVSRPLLLHWDGTHWRIDNSLDLRDFPGRDVRLSGVAALSSEDVWAVGEHNKGDDYQPFTAHWNGTIWQAVPSPSVQYGGSLSAVAPISPNDVWAVGSNGFTMHWNGKDWGSVRTPLGVAEHLNAVVAISNIDVWAFGGDAYGSGRVVVLHWDGTRWSEVPSPSLGPGQVFNGASKVSDEEIWAVGGTLNGLEEGPWYSKAARFIATPCPTNTP